MHAKDLRDPTTAASQCIVGEGVIPSPDPAAARDHRYQGYVNLEYEIDADDPLPGMKQSFALHARCARRDRRRPPQPALRKE